MSAMKRIFDDLVDRLVVETGCEPEEATDLLMAGHDFNECYLILTGGVVDGQK